MNIFSQKTLQNFSKAKKNYHLSDKWLEIVFYLMSAVEFVGVKILFVHWNEDSKIGIELICSSNTSRKSNKMILLKKLGFINVLSTVRCRLAFLGLMIYRNSQKHEFTLLHTYVLNKFLTADSSCTTKSFLKKILLKLVAIYLRFFWRPNWLIIWGTVSL